MTGTFAPSVTDRGVLRSRLSGAIGAHMPEVSHSTGYLLGDSPAELRHLAAQALAAEVVQADAAGTGLETGSFNMVHARTVLLTVTDPEAIVREMARLTRPGGVVALQEPDSASRCARTWRPRAPSPASR